MLKKMKKNEKGFTLVELVVVIAILAVLAMLLVPRIMGNVGESEKQKEIANARTLASEITVNNAMAKTAAEKVVASGVAGFGGLAQVKEGDLAGKLELPNGIIFPLNTVVTIEIDAKGNASINMPTP